MSARLFDYLETYHVPHDGKLTKLIYFNIYSYLN